MINKDCLDTTLGTFDAPTHGYYQSSFLFLKKKKVPSNTLIERETQEKGQTTQRQSVKTCDMKIIVHTQKKQEQHAWS